MPERPYAAIASAVPAELRDLAAMLLANRTPGAELQHADWLAHTIAAASFGNRRLWLDLGLSGRDAGRTPPCSRPDAVNATSSRYAFRFQGQADKANGNKR